MSSEDTTTDPLRMGRDYSELFEAFRLFGSSDIYSALELWQHRYMSTSWEQFGRHLERMQNYLADSKLEADKKYVISKSLELQQAAYLTGATYPEKRQYINEKDRCDLTSRRAQLIGGFTFDEEIVSIESNVDEHLVQVERAKRIIKELNIRLDVLNKKLDKPKHRLNSKTNDGKRRSAALEILLLQNFSASDKSPEESVATLASLCIPYAKKNNPEYENRQNELAGYIRKVWEALDLDIKLSCSTRGAANDMRASAVGVFKLMQWIGRVEKVGPAKWVPILEQEWNISISSGISKYRIDKNHTNSFVSVVKAAFKKVKKDNCPIRISKEQILPEEYQ